MVNAGEWMWMDAVIIFLHSARFEVAIWHKPALLHPSANFVTVAMPTPKPEAARCCEARPDFIWFLSGRKWLNCFFIDFFVSPRKNAAMLRVLRNGTKNWRHGGSSTILINLCREGGAGRSQKSRLSRHHPILFNNLVRSCAQVFLHEKIHLSEHGQGTCFSTCGIYVPWFDVFLHVWILLTFVFGFFCCISLRPRPAHGFAWERLTEKPRLKAHSKLSNWLQ